MHLLLLCLFFFSGLSLPADTLNLNSSIKNVTVFLSGAEIVRATEVSLKSGTNYIAFVDLPASLKKETVRLTTRADIVIKALSKVNNPTAGTLYADKLERLVHQKEQLQSSIQQKQTMIKILEQKRGVLLANQDLSGEGATVTIAELKQAMRYFGQQFSEIEEQKMEIKTKVKQLKKELKSVTAQIKQVKSARNQAGGVIEAVIESPSSQKITLTLSYVVPNAYWYPSYDIRVDDTNQPLGLTYKANIHQSTGIPWEQVNLTISSAQPRSRSALPAIEPVYIRFDTPRKIETARLKDSALKEKVVVATQQKRTPPPAPKYITFQQRQTAFSFKIAVPYSIQSNVAKTVAIKRHSLPAAYQYITIPKKREQVYLTAKITQWEGLHLLPGEANLFLDQSYVGSSRLNLDTTKDTLTFSLGQDKRITVKRTQIEQFTEKNFLGNKVTQTKGWKITLQNTQQKPVNIKVLDQVPRSSNETIDVSLEERSGAAFNAANGQLSWELTLPAGVSKKVSFVYQIEYPDDKQIEVR